MTRVVSARLVLAVQLSVSQVALAQSWARGRGSNVGSFVLHFGTGELALFLALDEDQLTAWLPAFPLVLSFASPVCRPRWLFAALRSCLTCILLHPRWDLSQQNAPVGSSRAPVCASVCLLPLTVRFAGSAWLLTRAGFHPAERFSLKAH